MEGEVLSTLLHRCGRVHVPQFVRKICSTCRCFSIMMLLAWSVLMVCLSASSESTVIYQEAGGSIDLTCSSDGCPKPSSGYDYLYLYYEFKRQEEVLFYDLQSQGPRPRPKYKHRIQANTANMTFTIRDLTAKDNGIYRCVFNRSPKDGLNCSRYTVFITETRPCSNTAPTPSPPPEPRTNLMLYIIFVCIISVLAMWIFYLLIIPKVKQWCIERRVQPAQTVSSDNVYETMSKNPGLQSAYN